jgi:ADP-heptose:LPS heptosyltransferase
LKPDDPARILPGLAPGAVVPILRLRSLGDVVLLTPALAALHAWRPDLKLHVLVEPAYAPVLEGNPAVAELILHHGFLASAGELRRIRPPVLFNQHGGPTSALLSAASGSGMRVCWDHTQFQWAYNVAVPPPAHFFGTRPVHTVEHRLTQFYYAGLPQGPIPRAQMFPQADAAAGVQRKLAERGISPGQRYAVIHPGASHASKRWSLGGFAGVARWLGERHHLRPVVRLGPGDAALAAEIKQQFPAETVLLDYATMDLREAIALIAGAHLFLGNDSGPAHIAAATGRPLVVLFGPADPVTWGPWQTAHRALQARGLCPACRAGRCYAAVKGRCILSLPDEAVREACAQMLEP